MQPPALRVRLCLCRFRRLKLTNAKFVERVWNNEQHQMLMLAAGWIVEEGGAAVVLPATADTNILWDLVNEMDPQPVTEAVVRAKPPLRTGFCSVTLRACTSVRSLC